jgi:peroxiredoxin
MLLLFVSTWMLSAVAAETPAPEDSDPRALLLAAAEAARPLRSATYQATASVVRAGGPAGKLSGEVRFAKLEAEDPIGAQLFLRGQAEDPGGAAQPFKLIYDGRVVRGQIGAEPVIYEAALGGAGEELLEVGELLLLEPLHAPERFAADLEGAELTLGPEVEVAGVPCREVVVQHGDRQDRAKVTWALALEDHLPRRRIGEVHRHGAFQTETLEIRDLRPDAGIHPSVFRFPTPSGFEVKPFAGRRARAGLLPVGSPAPDFALRDTQGNEVRLADRRGKVVVLDFWCTWSPPCAKTLPQVQKLHERFAADGRVEVLGLAVQERQGSDPEAALRAAGCTYPLLLNGERAAERYAVTIMPTLYVVGTDGRVLYAASGIDTALAERVGDLIERHLADG